jgi:hypothetical protein
MSAVRQLSVQPDLDAAALAELEDLELRGRATQTEFDAKRHFTQLAEALDLGVALADHNARVSRYNKTFDGKYRSVIYTLASAMDGSTHQIAGPWGSWPKLTERHNKWHPKRQISERQFRAVSKELAKLGVLEIKARKNKDTVPPGAARRCIPSGRRAISSRCMSG